MQVLAIGPTTWFWSNRLQQGGLTQQDNTLNGLSKIGITFDGHAAEQLQALVKNGAGDLTFDPSLNRAMAMAQTQESPIEHIAKGGLWPMPQTNATPSLRVDRAGMGVSRHSVANSAFDPA